MSRPGVSRYDFLLTAGGQTSGLLHKFLLGEGAFQWHSRDFLDFKTPSEVDKLFDDPLEEEDSARY